MAPRPDSEIDERRPPDAIESNPRERAILRHRRSAEDARILSSNDHIFGRVVGAVENVCVGKPTNRSHERARAPKPAQPVSRRQPRKRRMMLDQNHGLVPEGLVPQMGHDSRDGCRGHLASRPKKAIMNRELERHKGRIAELN